MANKLPGIVILFLMLIVLIFGSITYLLTYTSTHNVMNSPAVNSTQQTIKKLKLPIKVSLKNITYNNKTNTLLYKFNVEKIADILLFKQYTNIDYCSLNYINDSIRDIDFKYYNKLIKPILFDKLLSKSEYSLSISLKNKLEKVECNSKRCEKILIERIKKQYKFFLCCGSKCSRIY